MRRTDWHISYEEWENVTGQATAEPVAEAQRLEAEGWPMPISGDLLALARGATQRSTARHG